MLEPLLRAARERIEALARMLHGRHESEYDDLCQEGYYALCEWGQLSANDAWGTRPVVPGMDLARSRMKGWVSYCADHGG